MPSGQDMLSTPEERKLGFNDFFARLSEEGREYYKSAYVGKFTRFVTGCMGRTGKVDSWWLNMIQVHPDRQRQGIATALIGLVREKAKRKGETLALSASNPSNVPIYKAMGFDLKGDRIMPSPWGDWPLYLVALDTRDQI
ncbi:hypothetical protein AcW1_008638 [Taiwanofungus camphoratus]|nr:hypothetical protein AcV5_006657 [Antrodia cinnamomea]KAI0948893.1 hypothetical protein AcW1_008638 [Antrodia cinnamomea]